MWNAVKRRVGGEMNQFLEALNADLMGGAEDEQLGGGGGGVLGLPRGGAGAGARGGLMGASGALRSPSRSHAG